MENHYGYPDRRTDGATYSRPLPVCTIILILINVMLFLAGLLFPGLGNAMRQEGAFSLQYILRDREYYRLITAAFLHADTAHLINNCLILGCAGDLVERSVGSVRFCVIYLTGCICGHLLSAVYEFSTGTMVRSVGASGAVFALMGALLFLVLTGRGAAGKIHPKQLILALALSVYSGFRSVNVNNAAHIGGLLSGFLIAAVVCIISEIGRNGRK